MPTRPRRQALVQGDGLKSSRWIAAGLRQGVPGHAAHPSEREPRRGPAHRSPHFVRGQTCPPERTPRRVRGPPWTAQWPPHSAEGTPRRVRGRYPFVRGPPPLAGTPPPPRPGSSLNGAGWLPFPGAKTPPRPGNTPASPGAPPFHAGEASGLWKLPFQGRTPGLTSLAILQPGLRRHASGLSSCHALNRETLGVFQETLGRESRRVHAHRYSDAPSRSIVSRRSCQCGAFKASNPALRWVRAP